MTDPVAELAKLLKKAGPLAEIVNSDDMTDEDRGRLRALVGGERYVELSTNLNQMCSARTRDMAKAGVKSVSQFVQLKTPRTER